MQEIEKVENVLCAKEIRDSLLKALHLGPGEFATALGINYQRIYDLGSGRTKKFNPGIVNLICKKFPQVNPTYLYSGKGPILLETATQSSSVSDTADIIAMSKKLIELMEQINSKDSALREREFELAKREFELTKREQLIREREKSLGISNN